MDSILHLHPNPRSWLLESELAPHVGAYVDYLELGQYANTTVKKYVACVAHFARWQDQCDLELHRIDEAAVGQFLGEHLPHCDCPAPVCRSLLDLRPACRHLLHVLRDNAVIAESKPRASHDSIDEELQGFDEHMRSVRGLAPKTRRDRIRIVERLLRERFAAQPLQLSTLQPDEVRQFIAQQLEDHATTTHARALASALRAYFRYQSNGMVRPAPQPAFGEAESEV